MNKNKLLPQKWILIRGLTRSHFHWFDFKNILKSELNLNSVQFPELPGNGYLSDLNTPKNLSACVAELRKQIILSNEPVGLIGISMGGMIATQWALEFSTEVSHLVLINTSSSASPFYHRMRFSNYFKIIKNLFFLSPKNTEKFILSTTSNSKNWHSVFDRCVQFQSEHRIQFINLLKQLKMASQSRFTKKPDCEILILASEKDRLVNFKCSLEIAKNWNLSAEIHSTAGHDLPLDDSKWIIEKIKNRFTPV